MSTANISLSTITSNEFFHTSSSHHTTHAARRVIFFVTGNPGLIAYYHEFLSLLSQDVAAGTVIYGASLGGFEVDVEEETTRIAGQQAERRVLPRTKIERSKKGPFGLQDQIGICWERLRLLIEALIGNNKDHNIRDDLPGLKDFNSSRQLEVVLIGHSVGTYICLELIRLHKESVRRHSGSQRPSSFTPLPPGLRYTIPLSILLTPTITHISHSTSGRLLTPVFHIPYIPKIAQSLINTVTYLTTTSTFTTILKLVMGNPPPSALETTAKFLRGNGGVRQALHMARDEMQEIKEDKWDDDLWSATFPSESKSQSKSPSSSPSPSSEFDSPSAAATKLFLWFASDDHWVNNEARDTLLQQRGRRKAVADAGAQTDNDLSSSPASWDDFNHHDDSPPTSDGRGKAPTFLLSPKGELVHAFCFRHSALVARRVAGWLAMV